MVKQDCILGGNIILGRRISYVFKIVEWSFTKFYDRIGLRNGFRKGNC